MQGGKNWILPKSTNANRSSETLIYSSFVHVKDALSQDTIFSIKTDLEKNSAD
jgi:hypothetical protein